MTRSFTVQTSEEQYRIVASTGEESSTVGYADEPACLEISGEIYYCHMTDPDDEQPVVYRVASVDPCPSVVEDVVFDEDEEEEDEEPVGPVLVETENAG
jgi:hypothetical protein